MPSAERFRKFVFFLIIYTLLIILWGAFVRFSDSGAGCGKHWPLCQGYWIPTGDWAENLKTWIEYFHRAKSGILGLLIFAVGYWSLRVFPRKHWGRFAAFFSVLFTMTEAILGAWLVLKGLVEKSEAFERVFVIGLHFLNTIFLLGSLVALYLATRIETISWKLGRKSAGWVAVIWVGFFVLGATGSWASLSNTLYPSGDLSTGLQSDLQFDGPWLLRLRILHPLLALAIGSVILHAFFRLRESLEAEAHRYLRWFPTILITQFLFGFATLINLSPVWMRLVHLLLADLIWIHLIGLSIYALSPKHVRTNGGPTSF